eukprot:3800693-Amphidinium_carterae.1
MVPNSSALTPRLTALEQTPKHQVSNDVACHNAITLGVRVCATSISSQQCQCTTWHCNAVASWRTAQLSNSCRSDQKGLEVAVACMRKTTSGTSGSGPFWVPSAAMSLRSWLTSLKVSRGP